LAKDQLAVTYDPKKLAPEDLLKVVRAEGFEGKIIGDPVKVAPGKTPP
jgi:hypothetical protein